MNEKTSYLEKLVARHKDDTFVQIHCQAETGIKPKLSQIKRIRAVLQKRDDVLERKRQRGYESSREEARFRKEAEFSNKRFIAAYHIYKEKYNVA